MMFTRLFLTFFIRKIFILILICGLTLITNGAQIILPSFEARATSMGGAFGALAYEAAAIYYNSAGLSQTDFVLSFSDLDTEQNYLDTAGSTALVLGNLAYANTNFDASGQASLVAQYYALATDNNAGLAWGAVYKQVNDSGLGLDIGLLAHIIPGWSMGLNLQNITVKDLEAPIFVRIGAAVQPLDYLNLTADYVWAEDSLADAMNFGLELAATSGLRLRGGFNNQSQMASYGVGLSLGFGELNYAQVFDPQEDRDPLHQVSYVIGGEITKPRQTLIPQERILEINIKGSITSGSNDYGYLSGMSIGADRLLAILRQARQDRNVRGIILRLGNFPPDLFFTGMAQSLRSELQRARQQGIKITAYLEGGAMGNAYYLAAAADRIVAPPGALVGGLGTRYQILRTYDLFKMIGINWQYLTMGRYKASLSGQQSEITDEGEQMVRSLLKDIYEQLVVDIATDRSLDLEALRQLADGRLLTADEAREKGLLDEIGFYPTAKKQITALTNLNTDDALMQINELLTVDNQAVIWQVQGRIAVIRVEGEITLGESARNSLWGGRSTGAETLIKQIKQAQDDSSIKAVILRLETPGGSALASDRLYQAIKEARAEGLHFVASMGNIAASGGYFIAAACDRIVANPGTFTGSIGVLSIFPSLQELLDKLGIKAEEYQEGQYMDAFSMAHDLSSEAQKMILDSMEKTYERFIAVVAEGRNMTEAEVKEVARGRIYTGQQAYQRRLVDDLGNFSDAVRIASDLAELGNQPSIISLSSDDNGWLANTGQQIIKHIGLEQGLLPEIKSEIATLKIY